MLTGGVGTIANGSVITEMSGLNGLARLGSVDCVVGAGAVL
jgi:hypothetical protein